MKKYPEELKTLLILIFLSLPFSFFLLFLSKKFSTFYVFFLFLFSLLSFIAMRNWKYLIFLFVLSSIFYDNLFLRSLTGETYAYWGRWYFYILLFLHSFFSWIFNRKKISISEPERWFILFIGLSLLSFFYSINPTMTAMRAGNLALLYFISFLYLRVRFMEKPQELYSILTFPSIVFMLSFVGGIVLHALGLWEIFSGGKIFQFRGLSTNPNQMGMISQMAVPSSLFLLLYKKRSHYALFFILTLTCSILTGSRSAVIGTGTFLFLFLITTKRLKHYFPFFLLFLSLSLSVTLFSKRISKTIEVLLKKKGEDITLRESIEESRVNLWRYGIKFSMKKMILGHGFGASSYVWFEYPEDFNYDISIPQSGEGRFFENIYIDLFVALGITGLFIFGIFIMLLLMTLIKNLKIFNPGTQEHDIASLLFSSILSSLIYSAFISMLFSVGNYVSLFFWCWTTAGISLQKILARQEK